MEKNRVSVVYYSASGTTGQLAAAIAEGVNSVTGSEAVLVKLSGKDIIEGRYKNDEVMSLLTESNGIVFGSPTYMGGVAAQFKAFVDASSELWYRRAWLDKVAAGFTVGGSPSGEQHSTIQYLQVMAGQHGMHWAGVDSLRSKQVNRLGASSGLIAQAEEGELDIADYRTAVELGIRVANLAGKLAAA
ncbi:flavodoxin family protein [Endozoicomonas arenosclerae]|uniref:flavodoxin family protein n=1 Tax=Endozoicomonas arenosclerae TaxID=1633495 RepID=UPI000781FB26|nr:flavodoxin family protein [Endozoicomonas arenosclerae]